MEPNYQIEGNVIVDFMRICMMVLEYHWGPRVVALRGQNDYNSSQVQIFVLALNFWL